MKKVFSSLMIIVLCLTKSQAQQDSLKNKLFERQRFFTDSTAIAAFNFAKQNPLFIEVLMPRQISTISLGHQLEQGNFVAAQGSTKTNQVFLISEGTTELKGVKLYGSFNYNKTFEDSTKFAHQTRNNPSTPYYFGSPANNHYERTSYIFNALGSKHFFNEKVVAGLGLNYLVADHFSNNDPRGKIKEYQVNPKLVLGYNFSKHVQLGAGINFGYGREDVNIGYKNRLYYESTFYPLYVNYLVNGYGEPEPRTDTHKRQYSDLQNRLGVDVTLKVLDQPIGSFFIKVTQISEDQTYQYRSSDGILTLATYKLDKFNSNLLWIKQLRKDQQINATLAYETWDGEDFNTTYLAKNYVYTSTKSDLKINYSLTKPEILYQCSIGAHLFGEERIDGITGNKIYFQNLLLDADFGIQRKLNNNKSFAANIGLHYGINVADDFHTSAIVDSYFTQMVIFHDYLFNTASRFGGALGLSYGFPFFKAMQSAIKLNTVYTAKGRTKVLNKMLSSIPGEDRFVSNISFNLYF